MAVISPRHSVPVVQHPERDASSVVPLRWVGLSGAVYFALILAYASTRSGAPAATDSNQEVFDYVVDNQGRLQLGAVLLGFAMVAALVWLPCLVAALRRAEGGHPGLALGAFGGGVLAAAGGTIMALVQGALAIRVTDLGPEAVGMWWTVLLLATGATLLGLTVAIGATAVVALQHRFGPWFTAMTVLLALGSAVGAATIGYDNDAIQTIAGLALLFDSIWILWVGLTLAHDPDHALTGR